MTSETVNQLFEITNGNPQALLLVIGIIANGEFDPGYLLKEDRGSIGKLNLLYEISWNKLSTNSASLLTYFPLLSAKSCMEGEALRYISNLKVEEFNACISELNKWNLINFDGDNGLFCIHSTLLAFVNEKEYLKENQNSIRVKYILFYLQLAKHNIEREYPNEEYWNSLVSAKMDVLDLQRDAIFTAINWAFEIKGQELSVVNFAKIILHYLDSRFHNQLRIELVKKAIEICGENGDCYFEALLKIDALGWTLVEEGELQQASDTIQSGRELLECNVFDDAKKTDLLALSNAWLARVKSEQLATEEATQLIEEALKYNGRPWIEYRIHMAAGDVFYKLNDLKESLKNYQLALTRLREYNGEGSNYQINPRLALAYLRLGDTYLNEAEKIFTKLKQNTRIKIGELYGEFGLAMIEYERGFKDGVKEKVQKLEAEITKRSPKNLLLKLVTEYKNQKFP